MANFYINDTTTAGESLLADVIGRGGVFTPTRMVVGSGNMPAGTAAADMTALVKQEASFYINKKKRMPEQSNALIGGAFTNRDVTQGFTLKEIGIYAKAVYSDGTESSEVLYSYGNAGDQGDYIPAYSTSTVVERQIDITTYIGAEATVNLTVESQVYVSVAAHEALQKSLEDAKQQHAADKLELEEAIDKKANSDHKHFVGDITSGILPIKLGGTGANTSAKARENLNVYDKGETLSRKEIYKLREPDNCYTTIDTPMPFNFSTFDVDEDNFWPFGYAGLEVMLKEGNWEWFITCRRSRYNEELEDRYMYIEFEGSAIKGGRLTPPVRIWNVVIQVVSHSDVNGIVTVTPLLNEIDIQSNGATTVLQRSDITLNQIKGFYY